MNITIRKANIDDLECIQKLNSKLFEKEYREFDDSLKVSWPFEKEGENYFRDVIDNHYTIVAIVNENVVGYLAGSLNIQNSYNTTSIAELDNMFIEEEYRNQGIGKSLIQNFIEYCNKNNIDEIKVTASFKNKNAIQFYIRNGFEEFELTLKKKKD